MRKSNEIKRLARWTSAARLRLWRAFDGDDARARDWLNALAVCFVSGVESVAQAVERLAGRAPGGVFDATGVDGLREEESNTLEELFNETRVLAIDDAIDLFEINESIQVDQGWGEARVVAAMSGRKARGAFNTPPSLARELLDAAGVVDGATAGNARLLDPACGPGRLLVAALRRFLDGRPDGWTPQVSPVSGVDLNPRAAAFARSMLYQTFADNGTALAETPDLRDAVIVGDPLLAPDEIGDDALSEAVGALDVAQRLGARSFDFVVANPPYRFGEHLDARLKDIYRREYESADRQFDTYALFLERSVRRWLRWEGRYAFLVPDALLAREQMTSLRRLLIREGAPTGCRRVGDVFRAVAPNGSQRGVGVSVIVLAGARRLRNGEGRLGRIESPEQWRGEDNRGAPHDWIASDRSCRFLIHATDADRRRLDALFHLGATVAELLVPGGIGRGEEAGKRNLPDRPSGAQSIPVIAGEAVSPYRVAADRRYVAELADRKRRLYEPPRILVVKTGRRLVAAREDSGAACLQSLYCLRPRDEEAAVVVETWLNSDACASIVEQTITAYKGLMPQVTQAELLALPVPALGADKIALLTGLIQEARADNASTRARAIGRINAVWNAHFP